ncbi:MAG TPA: NifU family protein [Burkholderiales bacterium]|nr:NifU family protein [Burkholderiales bacterium]
MAKIADIESTPNPNAMKFILKEPLTYGVTRSYDSAAHAKDDPLASDLFMIPHVTNVFYVDHWVTVTQDGQANWQELLKQLAVPIRAANADTLLQAQAAPAENEAGVAMSIEDTLRLAQINEILDEQIRSYLQGDGGDLKVLKLEGNTLTIHYQGACGSCPSSIAGTLSAVENLLRTIEPDIQLVAV